MNRRYSSQKGFTLIELMISVVLGLLIVAAVTQVYVIAMRTASTQRASAGILDANVYGLQQVERSLRMAGLGLGEQSKLDSTCSGILLTSSSSSELQECSEVTGVKKTTSADGKIEVQTNASPVASLERKYWTQENSGTAANTTSTSMPQLTIQYRAPVDMLDCEGRLALGPRKVTGESASKKSEVKINTDDNTTKSEDIVVDGQVIVERYFVHKNTDNVLELRCDAMRYVPEKIEADNHAKEGATTETTTRINQAKITNSNISNGGDNGSLVIAGIDDFQVLLGVKGADKQIRYQTIAQYQASPSSSKDEEGVEIINEIVAVKMGIVAKGLVATTGGDEAPADASYTILGKTVRMSAGQPTNAIRRVYESNTMLRNSRGVF